MRYRQIRSGSIAVLILAVALLAAGNTAMARGRGRGQSNAARARSMAIRQAGQVAAGLKVVQQVQAKAQLEQAMQAQRASDAAGKLTTAESELKGVKADETTESEERKKLEDQIEKDAGYDHPVTQARIAYEQRKVELARCRERAPHSQEWQSQVEAAEKAGKSHAEIVDLEQQLLNDDPDYSQALAEYANAETKYHQLRHELFSKNEQWKENVAAARHSQAELSTAEGTADGQARRKIVADTEERRAARVAAAAAAEVAQRRAYLNAISKKYRIKVNIPPPLNASSNSK
jgi:hypothetical protein